MSGDNDQHLLYSVKPERQLLSNMNKRSDAQKPQEIIIKGGVFPPCGLAGKLPEKLVYSYLLTTL